MRADLLGDRLEQKFPALLQRAHASELWMLDVGELGAVTRWEYATLEAQLSRLFDPRFGLGDAADFSSQTHFPKKDGPRINAFLFVARCDRRDDAKIDRWLVDLDTAGNVNEDVLIKKLRSHFFFQYSDKQGNPIVIHADGRAPRHG